MAEDMGEKTEEPTLKRKNEARSRGQIAKSQDLTGALIMTGVTVLLALFGPRVFLGMAGLVRFNLSPERMGDKLTVESAQADVMVTGAEVLRVVLPAMGIMVVVTAVAVLMQVGFVMSGKSLEPSLNKLNPVNGAKKLFSKRSVVRAGLDILKFTALVGTGGAVLWLNRDEMALLTMLTVLRGLVVMGEVMLEVGAAVLVVLLLLALLDFTYQKWQHNEDLKMTKHEVKDERKSMEGDPEVLKRRSKMAQQIQGQRLQRDVPEADVVVTNPTHVSVALRYEAGVMGAPVVVAKGADYLALKIRQIAAASGVPIVERAPLARALYAGCEVGDEVPASSYEAVAEVLAFVYELEGRVPEAAAGGGGVGAGV